MARRVWFGVFGLWAVFLSGGIAGIVGSPGAIQWLRLNNLLGAKEREIQQVQESIHRLEADIASLEKSKVVQLREIRRVLGYAATDELIFDFGRDADSNQ